MEISGDYHYLLDKFPTVFSGEIGKLKDYQLGLSINSTVQSVLQNPRPILVHFRRRVGAKLKQLEEQDTIERVAYPAP